MIFLFMMSQYVSTRNLCNFVFNKFNNNSIFCMPLITFLSDFGWSDHYVAAVKAKILSEDASLQVY